MNKRLLIVRTLAECGFLGALQKLADDDTHPTTIERICRAAVKLAHGEPLSTNQISALMCIPERDAQAAYERGMGKMTHAHAEDLWDALGRNTLDNDTYAV